MNSNHRPNAVTPPPELYSSIARPKAEDVDVEATQPDGIPPFQPSTNNELPANSTGFVKRQRQAENIAKLDILDSLDQGNLGN